MNNLKKLMLYPKSHGWELLNTEVENLIKNRSVKNKPPLKAIREMCIQCMGATQNYSKLIKECASSNCAIFIYRFGKNPYHSKNISHEQRKELAGRFKSKG